jgi:hypothetical protein
MTQQPFYFENFWLEILKNLKEQHRAIPNFSFLVQYVCHPWHISRSKNIVFNKVIKKVWRPEKGQINLNTLEAHVDIKFNDKTDCRGLFNLVKSNKKILSMVRDGEKYKTASNKSE